MKKILTAALAALVSFAVGAATLNPVQLLSPAGSNAGDVIVSGGTGATPGWANPFTSPPPIGAGTPNTIKFTNGTSSIGPTSTAGATNLNVGLTSTYAGPGGGANNPPAGITINVSQSGSNAATSKNVRGIVSTVVDGVGNINATTTNNNFTEAGRFQSIPAPGVQYTATEGLITYAATNALPFMYAVGIESQVDNLYQNASAPTSSTNLPFVASFMASNGEPSGTFTADAAFMINPFNPSKFQTGFFAAGSTVSYASFATNVTGATYGMDLGLGSYTSAAIRIPNSSGIRARNAAGSSDLNILYLDSSNAAHIGTDATAVYADKALTSIGLFTPSSTLGIAGTTAGDSAQAGSWGEYQTATNSAVSLTNNTTANGTSKSLAAGDWDVQCIGQFNPAGTTTVGFIATGVSTTSATLGAVGTYNNLSATMTAGAAQVISSPIVRQNFSATTTVYCPVLAGFATSTMTATTVLRARRVR